MSPALQVFAEGSRLCRGVGLRGAVPIVLSIYPVLERAPGAHLIFNVVFFVVVVNAILPGATVAWATRLFGMDVDEPPRPHAVLELESMRPVKGELMAFYVDEALAVAHASHAGPTMLRPRSTIPVAVAIIPDWCRSHG